MTDFSDLIAARFGLPTKYGRERAAAGPLATILSRRSFRKYLDREVPVELINILLACAQSASAKSDLQQYSILHITEPALKTRLGEVSNTAWMATSPIVLVFCGDIHRAENTAAMRGRAYAQNNLDSFMNAAVDAALAMQTFILAAESEGLGCCPISHI